MRPETVIFDGGQYALFQFQKQDGNYRLILYKESGRKLKHGKRRYPIATVDMPEPLQVYTPEEGKP